MENLPKKKAWVWYPFLWALYPILFLTAHNIYQIRLSDAFWPATALLFASFFLVLLINRFQKNIQKTSLLVASTYGFFFSYGYFFSITPTFLNHKIFLPLWILFFSFLVVSVVRTKKDLNSCTKILNITTLVLICFPTIRIVNHSLNTRWIHQESEKIIKSASAEENPDIYYFIFDRYAGFQTLQNHYRFNNSAFLQKLKDKGFYLALKSKSNYLKTAHSLASSLNLNYINYLSEKVGTDSADWNPIYNLLKNHKVGRFLKEKGYQFIHFGSWWEPTRHNNYADLNVNWISFSELIMVLYQKTILYPIATELKWKFLPLPDPRYEHYQRIRYKLKQLRKIPKLPGSKFVFVHMISPHVPYIFDQYGNYLTYEETLYKTRRENYLAQLAFLNNQILELVEVLLSQSKKPPIIILQSDEGPLPIRYEQNEKQFKWKNATKEELKEKLDILNAYYFPGVSQKDFYPEISPVNSFRLLFNLYFGTKLKLLPDESFAFEDEQHLYRFFKVTELIR